MLGDLLLGFEAENYRSIRTKQRLVLTRSSRNANDGFDSPKVVPAAAIFGANASGKSNLLNALRLMHSMIQHSATADTSLPFQPFLLAEQNDPSSRFEIEVVLDGIRHAYEFSYNRDRILSERLLSWPRGRQRVLFERRVDAEEEWYFGDSLTGANQASARATRSNALFLSTARLLNHDILGPLQQRLVELVRFVGSEPAEVLAETLDAIQRDPHLLNKVAGLAKRADLGVTGLEIEEDEEAQRVRDSAQKLFDALQQSSSEIRFEMGGSERALVPRLRHTSAAGGISLPFAYESLGTRNFIALLGPVLQRLATGGVLVVDEMDTSLHARLVNELVRLFQDPDTNPRQAQLILSTHDVTVMMNTGDYDVLDRDQVWFTAKTHAGETLVYPLAEFSVRATEAYSRSYLLDRFGGVPRIERDAFSDFLSNREDEDAAGGAQDGPQSS